MKKLICIVGESGSGKSAIYDGLRKRGFKVIDSFTTRPRRRENEHGHIFVSKEEFEAIRGNLVAYTMFNGYEYGTTREQIETSDFYIIDPAGLDYLAEKVGRENLFVVYIYCGEKERLERMTRERGRKSARERINHDKDAFRNFLNHEKWDVCLANEHYYQLTQIIEILSDKAKEMR